MTSWHLACYSQFTMDSEDLIQKDQLDALRRRSEQTGVSLKLLLREAISKYLQPDGIDEGLQRAQLDALGKAWDNDEDSVYDDC